MTVMVPVHEGSLPARCATWSEHEWASQRFLETSRHPSMGRYVRSLVRCAKCGRETTMTEWLDLPVTGDVRSLAVSEKGADA